MVATRRRTVIKALWVVGLAALVVVAGRVPSGTAAEGDDPKPGGKAATPDEPAKVRPREVFEALRELQEAVQKENRAARKKASKAKLPPRPARQVTPPTIDPPAIDALLEKGLAESKAPLAAQTTDVEFVRRVYLDVVGKLPTVEQTVAFVNSNDRRKRALLIDQLLAHPDFARNWARYWRDVISYRAPNPNPQQVGYQQLEDWLAEQFAANRPWDEIATGVITAKGRFDENGASAFTLAQMAEAVEIAGEVSRVFLGVQIQCAQCHDHPNDPWKREQFHGFASFFAGLQGRRATPVGTQPQVFEVVARANARYSMPDLEDPQKQIPVAPRFFLDESGTEVSGDLPPDLRRELAASFVTGQDNPWFARAFVNRVWAALIGEGFVNPIDDIGPTREPTAPELFETLSDQWQKGGYDVRWLFRTILNTRAYQRQIRSTANPSGRTSFAANCSSQLRADQILDALSQAIDLPLDGKAGDGTRPRRKAAAALLKGVQAKGMRGLRDPRRLFAFTFGVDPSTPPDEVMGTIPQSLFLMNNPIIHRGTSAAPGTVLGELLATTPDNRAVLDALYLRTLARKPTPREVQVCGRYVESVGNRREAFEDIFWSLINSTEFVSRR